MKTSIQHLVAKLDNLCRVSVKEKAGYRCERCGNAGWQIGGERTMAWAHIVGRGKRETRWGFTMKDGSYCWNAFCLCGGCHMWFDNAENRAEHDDWLESKLGRAKWMELKERARQIQSWGIKELRKKLEEVKSVAPLQKEGK